MRNFVFLLTCLVAFICNIQDINAAALGDYRTISANPVEWNDATKWETYNGSTWIAATNPPTSSAGVISILHTTWISATDVIADQIEVQTGGELWITGSASLYLTDGVGDDLVQDGGILRLYSYIRKSGGGSPSIYIHPGNTFEWLNNELGEGVTLTIPIGATTTMGGFSNKINLGTVNNYGTLNWETYSISVFGGTSAGTINNYGIFNITSDNGGSNYIYFTGQNLTNMPAGIINIDLALPFTQSTLYFQKDAVAGGLCINQGTINVNKGRLNFMEGGTQTGIFHVGGLGMLDFWTEDITFGTGAGFTGTGEVRKYCNWILAVDITLNNPFLYWGLGLSGSGGTHTLTLQGTDTLQSCTLYETARIVIGTSGTLLIRTAGARDIRGIIDNKGILNWVDGQFNCYGATNGTIYNESTFMLNTTLSDLYSYDINWSNSSGSTTTIAGGNTVYFTQMAGGISYTGNGTLDIQEGTLFMNAPATHNDLLMIAIFATLYIENSQTFIFTDDSISLSGTINGGYFVMNGSTAQTIAGDFMGISQINKLRINNAEGVFLVDRLNLLSGLDFVTGMLHVQDADLRLDYMATTSGTDSTQYIMTDGIGTVGISIAPGDAATYYVGSPLHYMPMTLTQAQTASPDFYTIRCINEIYGEYDIDDTPMGAAIMSQGVRGTWLVAESDPGGVDITLTACWTQSAELANFTRNSNVHLGHFSDGLWDLGAAGVAATNGNLFCISRSGITSLSPFVVTNQAPLPIERVAFYANSTDNQSVTLEWQTFIEKNTEKFIIERENLNHKFEPIIEVQAVGNTDAPQQYNAIDKYPLTGKNVYRLRSIDIDGQQQIQGQVEVLFQGNQHFSVYPNPFVAELWLTSPQISGEASISLIDNTGRVLYQSICSFSSYNTAISLPISNLASGLYQLKIVHNGVLTQIPIVKQ